MDAPFRKPHVDLVSGLTCSAIGNAKWKDVPAWLPATCFLALDISQARRKNSPVSGAKMSGFARRVTC